MYIINSLLIIIENLSEKIVIITYIYLKMFE